MKKIIILALFLTSGVMFAQFKGESNELPDLRSKMVTNYNSSFLLGFLNMKNLQMNNSFSMSYSSFGGQGLALGVFTNTLSYKFNNKLNFILQTSIVNSPYSSFSSRFSKNLNGIYIRRAQLNYRPTDKTFISIQFSNDPTRYVSPGFYGGYYNPFFGDFNEDFNSPKK